MRENYKGFTLVELLAIIVILAIIALITTPIILNIIEKSRLNAAKDKAWGTIDAVRIAYATAQASEQEVGLPYTIKYPKTSASDSTTDSSTGGGTGNGYINSTEIKVSGENPIEGTVTISNNGTITASSLKFGNYYCSTINGKGGKADATKMYCSRTATDVVTSLTPTDLASKVVTSGDGLYSDSTETGRYVFKGVNPNNYITLGSDMYRIIAVESDGTLKVIKNSSIGSKAFDTSNARYSTMTTDYCTSPYGCNVWGSKTTTLNSSGNNVTTMPKDVEGTSYNLPDSEAYLNTYLNNDWYNSLSSTVQNKIVTHLFNVGYVKSISYETGDTTVQTLEMIMSQEQVYKWKGKVGLMSLSDYVKSNTNVEQCGSVVLNNKNHNTCKSTNWIFSGPVVKSNSWIITNYGLRNYEKTLVCNVGSIGNCGGAPISADLGVAPVFFLSSNIILTGEGTSSSPYAVN